MKILTIGDIVSRQGCEYLRERLPALKKELGADIVIANGENSAVGNGILPQSAQYILDSGVDVITLGNHSLRRREIYDYLESDNPIIRPANYHSSAPGRGMITVDKGSFRVAVINLQGSVYLDPVINPFEVADELINKAKEDNIKTIIIDFHAEATSEKRAMGFYVDGRVSAIYGTHTHTQTNDCQLLPNNTAYVSDIGMTGPYYSVLGVCPEEAIEKLKTGLPVRFTNPDGPCVLEGCLFEIDEKTGKALSVQLIRR
ncbi:MAG: TIGR00282 family metallophosphoesterase [Eubacterium sp.]